MSVVAIVGAGPIGAATAHRLACRDSVRHVRFVDASVDAASGKALDIQQAGPVENFNTRLSAAADLLAAAAADVIVVADRIVEGEWRDGDGRHLVATLARAGTKAPIVFAGPSQFALMEHAYAEFGVAAHRLVGTAPSALASAVQMLAGVEMDAAAADVTVVGRPPSFVVGWTSATADGSLVSERVPAHRLLAISNALPRLWPPGPDAIGAATARIVDAIIHGARHHLPALTILDGELGARGKAVMLPLELGRLRVLAHALPSLSPQERTEMVNGLG
jgi:malate dehydrogenase